MADVLHARQAGLEEREARLHEDHEDRREDDPDRAGCEADFLETHTVSTSSSFAPVRLWVTWLTGEAQQMPSPAEWPVRAASTIAAITPSAMLVADDERHQRLRQKARLEHPAAVLVRDALLAAVTDRLDHGDADVPGRRLDGLHHRLDAVTDDDRLNFHHLPVLLAGPQKSPRARREH